MEKYGVMTDPEKIKEYEKKTGKKAPQTPEQNVPIHPEHGTEPFEKTEDTK
jgi:hypothetical protein